MALEVQEDASQQEGLRLWHLEQNDAEFGVSISFG
jgi:hypothetical protein